jgi:hypothetical protein
MRRCTVTQRFRGNNHAVCSKSAVIPPFENWEFSVPRSPACLGILYNLGIVSEPPLHLTTTRKIFRWLWVAGIQGPSSESEESRAASTCDAVLVNVEH